MKKKYQEDVAAKDRMDEKHDGGHIIIIWAAGHIRYARKTKEKCNGTMSLLGFIAGRSDAFYGWYDLF